MKLKITRRADQEPFDITKEEKYIREIYKRLSPEARKTFIDTMMQILEPNQTQEASR